MRLAAEADADRDADADVRGGPWATGCFEAAGVMTGFVGDVRADRPLGGGGQDGGWFCNRRPASRHAATFRQNRVQLGIRHRARMSGQDRAGDRPGDLGFGGRHRRHVEDAILAAQVGTA